ncbi:MAG: class I SAM-dependent methyltransferase [Victivallales bacterium]
MTSVQDKKAEIEFFNSFSGPQGYDVFDAESKDRLVGECLKVLSSAKKPETGVLFADLGCGSGVFTGILKQKGFRVLGLDLSHKILEAGKKSHDLNFVNGDVEFLPFKDSSIDFVMFSGMLHHLPDKELCAVEAFRVLKPGGAFVAFDPNKQNPFMWLYRDISSPLHSQKGVTKNECPISAVEVEEVFGRHGFKMKIDYLSGLHYKAIASSLLRPLLPLYNFLDAVIFSSRFMRKRRSFIISVGQKPF